MSRFARSFSAEFRKATATRTWWVLAIVLGLYSGLIAAMFGFLFSSMGEQLAGSGTNMPEQLAPDKLAAMVYSTPASIGYAVPLLLGVLIATGELRHRTLAATFSAEPKRLIVVSTKHLVTLLMGALIGIVGVIGTVAIGASVLAGTGGEPNLGSIDTWLLLLRVLVAVALWAVIGFGLGILVGNQAIAIVLALVFTQFLEPILRMAAGFWDWSASVGRFLPGAAADAFVGASVMSIAADPSMTGAATPLTDWQGLLVLLGYIIVLALIGWFARLRRDVQ